MDVPIQAFMNHLPMLCVNRPRLLPDQQSRSVSNVTSHSNAHCGRVPSPKSSHDVIMIMKAFNCGATLWHCPNSGAQHKISLILKYLKSFLVSCSAQESSVKITISFKRSFYIITQRLLLKELVARFHFASICRIGDIRGSPSQWNFNKKTDLENLYKRGNRRA